jgi:hypothetical protein
VSLHVASGRFTSVLDPKQIVGLAPWQEANARFITVASTVGPKRMSPNGPQQRIAAAKRSRFVRECSTPGRGGARDRGLAYLVDLPQPDLPGRKVIVRSPSQGGAHMP